MRIFWGVAIGAALGGLSRYYLAAFIQQHVGGVLPIGTLVINISGSILLGFIMRYSLEADVFSDAMRIAVTTGFCGGYTTFSTFSYDTALLLQDGEYARAGWYVGGSVVLALAGVFLGFAAANALLGMRAPA